MSHKKNVLVVGIDPKYIDFSLGEFAASGLTAEKVEAGIKGALNELNNLNFSAQLCWADLGPTAISVLETLLKQTKFDIVIIGAGIRKPDSNFILFEKMINSIHELAPGAKICFNTNPMDTVAAVQRWS